MSSSSEAGAETRITPLSTPELRSGSWTRYGSGSVLGDTVTEQTLSELAESTRRAANAQGYAVGWASGQRKARAAAALEAEIAETERLRAEAVREQEHRTAVTALEHAAQRLQQAVEGICSAVEEEASTLAMDLTRTLLDRELRTVDGAETVARALGLLPEESIVRIRVRPQDQAAAREAVAGTPVSVVADPELGPGDALVEVEEHVIDLRISTAVERLAEVLR